ncbi:MAG: hypothetical protein QW797_07695 [Thermoproteota archaeon]
MRLKPSYLFLAVFSAVFAALIIIYFAPVAEAGLVRDLMWVTFIFLVLNAVLSAILASVKNDAENRSGQKSK